jgi:type I restriction-modification system DNA methylase subunit
MAREIPRTLTEPQKDLLRLIDRADQREHRGRGEMFRTFLAMAYNAIKKATVLGAAAEACEAAYMEEVNRLRDPQHTAPIIADALGCVTVGLEEGLHDFMGPVFMETISNPHVGQFFTPDELGRLMAEMTAVPDLVEKLSTQDHVTAMEPAGGTGGMVLAVSRALADRGLDFSRRVAWRVVELDRAAYWGCYIQLSLAGVNAEVINGNSLTLEVFDQAITPVRLLHSRPFTELARVRRRARPSYVETP